MLGSVKNKVGQAEDMGGMNRAVSRGQERIKLKLWTPKSCVLHTTKSELRLEVV